VERACVASSHELSSVVGDSRYSAKGLEEAILKMSECELSIALRVGFKSLFERRVQGSLTHKY
jgi:hypothetical protein